MSGINGLLYKRKDFDVLSPLILMNERIMHRGPNDSGYSSIHHNDISIGMGIQRLSISDIAMGSQPVYSKDDKIVIVFGGTIYNKRAIQTSLVAEDLNFCNNSDAELILKLYIRYGVEAFEMLDGMYAFSVYDKDKNKLFLVRDFFGEKPLYYYNLNDKFIWASELKSIISVLDKKPEINKLALNLYFQLTYIPAPYSIYEDIHKLEPDHFIVYDLKNKSFAIKPIIRPSENKFANLNDKDIVKSLVHDKVLESIASRSCSDATVGAFLSGGVDSSIVSFGMAQNSPVKIDTFSIGFEKKSFDETDKARVVAKLINSNHHEFIIGENDLFQDLDSVLLNFDEPFADSSALPTYFVAKRSKEKVSIALTGDGGDEVFGGYNKYYMGRLNQFYTNAIPKAGHSFIKKFSDSALSTKDDKRGYRFKLRRLIDAVNYQGEFYYGIISLGFSEEEISSIIKQNYIFKNAMNLYKNKVPNPKSIHDFRAVDRILSLEGGLLVKSDRTSMLTSLECRSPFLNRELWEFSNQIPQKYLIKGWDKKHILKEAFKDYFPKGFLDKSKKGFNVPVGDWLRGLLREELEEYSSKKFIEQQGIFNIDSIQRIISEHLSGKVDNTYRVWTYYCFQKWYKFNFMQLL